MRLKAKVAIVDIDREHTLLVVLGKCAYQCVGTHS